MEVYVLDKATTRWRNAPPRIGRRAVKCALPAMGRFRARRISSLGRVMYCI
jgi:hypothetical protein